VLQLNVPLPGRAHLSNVLAAITVAIEFGVPAAAIQNTVAALKPVSRRGSSTMLRSGVRVVDDSYNASPAALQVALRTLVATSTNGRRVAILGEMRELGASSEDLHRECGRLVAHLGVNVLIAIGGAPAQALASGALAEGMPLANVHQFANSVTAADSASALIEPGDLVLVKGSRGTRTDIVSDRLLEVA
jgi:UDP-N-acetylmuramoyl-tripeptide--D-alanyl-D-alanine ligase